MVIPSNTGRAALQYLLFMIARLRSVKSAISSNVPGRLPLLELDPLRELYVIFDEPLPQS